MRFLLFHKFSTKLKIIFLFVLSYFLLSVSSKTFAQKKKYVVVLDAGHGGHDSGNLGNGYVEKKIALKVTLLVGQSLAKNKDIKVIYTRKNDSYPPLWKRGEIANKAKADLFVSIHCDSYTPRPAAHGAGTFVLGLRGNQKNLEVAKRENAAILKEKNYKEKYKGFDPNSAESVIGLSLLQEENLDKSLEIASLLQDNFTGQLKRLDRKVRQDNFQVLRETIMPSVLVELGFLTNKKEGKYLNSKTGQRQMAKAIAAAVRKYFNRIKLNTVQISEAVVKDLVEYKVQIASGRSKIPTKSYNFKGLKNVERIKVGSFYKYYYGKSSQYKDVKTSLTTVKKKGYTSAFIVAYKNGEKITVSNALKLQ
ncbi:N-acetylmuramoyl-L-alanine amidase [Lutibacter sp. Hel_I_33_5]|uniref:N-acetylmuramoyl-L-alanine amidase family protein n=1 Tax=Lutibacter sp. Hel_I_33_5 TaxID=1566289 RepID=UPI0011A64E54|nr:N-acetylmuramoyl-L-alanine amidase [Lutibacter sp. Hel_I_33_5]